MAIHRTQSISYVSSTARPSTPTQTGFLQLETRRRGTVEFESKSKASALALLLYTSFPLSTPLSAPPLLVEETHKNKRNANDLLSSQRKGKVSFNWMSFKEGRRVEETHEDLCQEEVIESSSTEEVPIRGSHGWETKGAKRKVRGEEGRWVFGPWDRRDRAKRVEVSAGLFCLRCSYFRRLVILSREKGFFVGWKSDWSIGLGRN